MIGQLTRVSTSSSGSQVVLNSYAPSFSPDGNYVVFASNAAALVAGDTNSATDIFLKNLLTGAVTRLSTDVAGLQANFGSSRPIFSPDGGRVLFESDASDLVPGDTNGATDVFLKTLATGAIARVSSGGPQFYGSILYGPGAAFSPDGTKVVFSSTIGNFVGGDLNNDYDVFVKDLGTQVVAIVSAAQAGSPGDSASSAPTFSPDGTKVAFYSNATNLVLGDTNNVGDLFIKTLAGGAIARVSVDSNGLQANDYSYGGTFSPDGGRFAFDSSASNLVPGDTNAGANGYYEGNDVFIKDLATGAITRASTDALGAQANGGSFFPVYSPDGTKLMFESLASNLVPDDTNGERDLFIKDLVTGAVTRVSVSTDGAQSTGGGFFERFDARFSADGRAIVFASGKSGLVPGDTNFSSDVFVKTIGGVATGDGAANTLAGGAGDDTLSGLGGDDLLLPGAGRNLLDGGAGQDTAAYTATLLPVYADLRTGGGFVNGRLVDALVSIENLTGGSGNDLLVGDDGPNVLNGGAGTDQLQGMGGDDRLVGGTSTGGTQNQLFGGAGQDTVDYSAQTAAVYVELRAPAGYVGGVLKDLMNSVENAVGGSGDDTIVGTDADNNVLGGGAGTDLLFGFGGDDVLIGGPAAGGQYNQLFGGAGFDTASYAGMSGSVYAELTIYAGYVSSGGSLVLTDVYNAIENLTGGSGADTLAGDGAANRLTGAGGADILYGRGGPDTFVLAAAPDSNLLTGYDTIADFETGLDKLDLTALHTDAAHVLIASSGGSTAFYADLDPATPGYELALSVVGANAIALGDILF